MDQVQCSRCGGSGEALPGPPLPGDDGRAVHERVCRPCWTLWLGEQVKLINETRVSPADPDGYAFLVDRMREFLRL